MSNGNGVNKDVVGNFVNIKDRRDFNETRLDETPVYESYKTTNYELTDELLGKLVNSIYESLGSIDADKYVRTNPNGRLDPSLVDLSGLDDHSLLSNLDQDDHIQYLNLSGIRPMTGDLNLNSNRIINLIAPVDKFDAANKEYIDTAVIFARILPNVRIASTGNVDLSSMPGLIDGMTLSVGDRILIKNQTDPTENGLYDFNGGVPATRSSDFSNAPLNQVYNGCIFWTLEGVTNGGKQFYLSSVGSTGAVHSLGTDSLTFSEYRVTDGIIAGAGVSRTGDTLSADIALNQGLQFISNQLAVNIIDLVGPGTIAAGNTLGVDFATGIPGIDEVYRATELDATGGAALLGADPTLISQSTSQRLQIILEDMSSFIDTIRSYTLADETKLSGIQAGAQVNPTAAQTKVIYESNPNTNQFSDAEQLKLSGLNPGAEVNPTAAEIKVLYESNADTNEFDDAEQSKLLSVETNAQVNAPLTSQAEAQAGIENTKTMTALRVQQAIDANLASAVTSVQGLTGDVLLNTSIIPEGGGNLYFTGPERTKLIGIETSATADQTPLEIKISYESNTNTNAFTDAEQTKLANITTGAEKNAPLASQAEAQAGIENTKTMTALRVAEAIAALESVTSVNGLQGTVVLISDDIAEGFTNLYFTNAERAKLTGIEAGAQVNPTDAETKFQYENNVNTNEFNDAEKAKLASIDPNARNYTDAEIKVMYENNPDTNEFSDAEEQKLEDLDMAPIPQWLPVRFYGIYWQVYNVLDDFFYYATTSHMGSTTMQPQIDDGTWVPFAGGLDPRIMQHIIAPWITAHDYEIGNQVIGPDGNYYEALVDHTSNVFMTDYSTAQWRELTKSSHWVDWVTSTYYEINDIVRINGKTYIALVDGTSGTFATDLAAGWWGPISSMSDNEWPVLNDSTELITDIDNLDGVAVKTAEVTVITRRRSAGEAQDRISRRVISLWFDETNWHLYLNPRETMSGNIDGLIWSVVTNGTAAEISYTSDLMPGAYNAAYSRITYWLTWK